MASKTKTERRRNKRVDLQELQVTMQDSGKPIGELINLSFGGMLVKSDTEFKADTIHKLRISFETPLMDRNHIDLFAECVWCHPEKEDDRYNTGFVFALESGDKIILIDQLSARFAKQG